VIDEAVSDEIRVRKAGVGDEGELAALCVFVQELHFRARPDVFKEPDAQGLEEWFRSTLVAGAGEEILIAEIESVPVGYALVKEQRREPNLWCHERHWWEVEQVSVHPDYRRHGVARALLRHVVESANAAGVADVELTTWSFNDVALGAFGRVGFAPKIVRLELRSLKP